MQKPLNKKLLRAETAMRLSRSKGVGAKLFKDLVQEFSGDLYKAFAKYKVQVPNMSLSEQSLEKDSLELQIKKALSMIEAGETLLAVFGDDDYPESLKRLSEPPPVFFMNKPFPRELNYAAVVGARNADKEGLAAADQATKKLIEKGFVIISGLAKGIDTQAHTTALKKNVLTAAILATGINICYPRENRKLYDEINAKGILATEMFPDAQPLKSFFPTRARLIASLSDMVCIVQASKHSGSLITAKRANELGLPVYTVSPPQKPVSPEKWEGNQYLLDSGLAKEF